MNGLSGIWTSRLYSESHVSPGREQLLVVHNVHCYCKSDILPDGWTGSVPLRFSGHSSRVGCVFAQPSLPCTPFYRKEPNYGDLLFQLRRYGKHPDYFHSANLPTSYSKESECGYPFLLQHPGSWFLWGLPLVFYL